MPWAHEADWYRHQHDLTSKDWHSRTAAQLNLPVWEYKDARFREDGPAADAAWHTFRQTKRLQQDRGEDWWATMATSQLVHLAAVFDDIDAAAQEVLEWYSLVDTRDLENEPQRRTAALTFISACIDVLKREMSIGHPRETEVDTAMRDVAACADELLMDFHHKGFRRIGEIRALHRSRVAIAEVSRWHASLPAVGTARYRRDSVVDEALTLADAALETAEIHDDIGPLEALVSRLQEAGTAPSLLHLMRARRYIATGDLLAALSQLEDAASATDRLAPKLRPQIYATQGRVMALHEPDALEAGIAACRTGRRMGLRLWRRVTAADSSLARLLLMRALRPGTAAAQRATDVREAVRLARRRCRPWHRPGADERVVFHDAVTARDALTGRGTTEQQRRAWLKSADAPWSTEERARLATAWVAWAVGTGDPELAAEAYQHLVALVPQDAAARYGTSAKQRVLAAAQEHTEEAGYWLARTRRYREAVVALETGRAIGLSEAMGRDGSVALDVTYGDIISATGEGMLVYIAAAKAGGYALIVAADHDPQFVELPKLDRASVAALLVPLLPGVKGTRQLSLERDLIPIQRHLDSMTAGLKVLWGKGIRDLLLFSARGQVVTLVPVGLLSLLPLHAAGEPGEFGDQHTEWRHAGHFSAIRYAPNARSLRRCQVTARELNAGAEQRLLAVDIPDGFGVDAGRHLRYVAVETAEVKRRSIWPATIRHDCTWEQFRDTAGEYTVWHLACHGSANPYSILDSRLCFADKEVTLEELRLALHPGQRRLAVLSACDSNLTSSVLPNEVVGLPSALLQIGFAGVIASSWKVDDLATAYLMTAFYQEWCQEGYEPAVALNRAQQWLRTATRADLVDLLPGIEPGNDSQCPYLDPRYWAAFAYTGA